jgi:hypothetical protein
MARRNAPPNSGPSYYTPGPGPLFTQPRGQLHDPNESAFSRFVREQVLAPEKLPGNVNILTSVGLFLGGILAVRKWGDMLVLA